MEQQLLQMLTCQVCWDTLTGQIFRCKFEHLMCKECFERLDKCPTCRGTLRQKLRSLCMEQIAEALRASCEYSNVGCPELVQLKEKRRHEEACPFRPGATEAQCPLVYSCSWLGSRAAVEDHIFQEHPDEVVVAPDGVFSADASSTTVLEFDSALFVVRVESVSQADFASHYVHVGHVAQGLRAAEARYRFKVRLGPDGVYYKGLVTDYRQPLEELAAAGGCLYFVSQVDEPKQLYFSGTIKKILF